MFTTLVLHIFTQPIGLCVHGQRKGPVIKPTVTSFKYYFSLTNDGFTAIHYGIQLERQKTFNFNVMYFS